ncbi:unnamed protein product [Closterium sp. Yama58-4]|nr:unnamed protein product [Closterium sp. Yama58-4]
MKAWSWQDSLRQAATIRTLPHAWKDHLPPQQQQLDAQLPPASAASFEKLLNACNSSPAFSSRLAPLDDVACASLPALEPLPRGAELVSVRASSDQFSPASSLRLSAAHFQPPVPSPAGDAPGAESMKTDEAQEGQRCEWEGGCCEADEVMSPRSSTGSCCDPDDLDSLLEAPHAFGQLAWESEIHSQSSHSRSSSCDLALPPDYSPSATCDSRLPLELLESASSSFTANPHFQLSSQCVIDGERIPEMVLWLLQQGSGHEDDMMAQLQQVAAVLAVLEAREGVVHGERALPQNSESMVSAGLTDLQKKELTDAFRRIDKDGDGVITADELASALNLIGVSASEDVVSSMMREGDFDGNGSVNLEEFLALNAMAERLGGDVSRSVLKDVFQVFDVDHNGMISADELFRVMANVEGGGVTLDECKRMISSVDMDGDGFVDFPEFERMMQAQNVVRHVAC